MSLSFDDHQVILRQKFAERTVQEAKQMETFADALAGPERPTALKAIRHIAHRLAGGSSIFGLGELGGPATKVERLIDEKMGMSEIREAVQALVRAINDLVGEPIQTASEGQN